MKSRSSTLLACNEIETLGMAVENVSAVAQRLGLMHEIITVNDGSPDAAVRFRLLLSRELRRTRRTVDGNHHVAAHTVR